MFAARALVFVNTGKASGPLAFANVALLTGDSTLALARLTVPAAAGVR